MRTLWNRYFQPAAGTRQTIFGSVLFRLETKPVYWWRLVNPPLERLRKASILMAEAADDNTVLSLEEVQERQNEVYGAYWSACYWVAKIAKEEGTDLTQVPTPYELDRSREAHVQFMEKVRDLVERPAHRKLHLRVHFEDDAAFRLLKPDTGQKVGPLEIEGTGTVTPPYTPEEPAT